MILEGLVTTVDADGRPHLAPMGPHVEGLVFDRLLLRPFSTSQTCHNLLTRGEGVLHVTDDVLLLARAAIGRATLLPPMREADRIRGFVLKDCCRYCEFRVTDVDQSQERVAIQAEVVHQGRVRDFFGLNRAKHAVVEAAILATRTALIPAAAIRRDFERLSVIIAKTGGADEIAAMAILNEFVHETRS